MRYVLLFISFLLNFNAAQAAAVNEIDANGKKQVAGLYRFKSSDPVDSGSQLILMNDKVYALATFFGFFTGTWSMTDGVVTLSAQSMKNHYLYGRYTESLGMSALFSFRGDDLRAATVNFNSIDESSRKTVFNSDANCFSQPFLYKLNDSVNELELGYPDKSDYSYGGGIHFSNYVNNHGYNDFQVFVSDRGNDAEPVIEYRVVENGLERLSTYSSQNKEPEFIAKLKHIGEVSEEQLTAIRLQIKSRNFPNELKFDHQYFPYLTREQEQDSKETASYFLVKEVSIRHDQDTVRPKKHLLTSRCN